MQFSTKLGPVALFFILLSVVWANVDIPTKTILVPTPTPMNSPDNQLIIVPYEATNYKYKVVEYNALKGFAQPDFNDSEFYQGDAAFGYTDGKVNCPLNNPDYIHTTWLPMTDLLVRKSFTVPRNVRHLVVSVAIDNDVQVFINGHDISDGMQIHDNCAQRDSFVFDIPDQLLSPNLNLLAIRARDRGVLTYLDIQISGIEDITTRYVDF